MISKPKKIISHIFFILYKIRINAWSVCSILFFIFLITPLRAELIVFSDQSILEGAILEQNDGFIIIKSEGQKFVIRRNLVENVLSDEEGKKFLKEREIQKKNEEIQKKQKELKKKIKEQAEKELKKSATKTKDTASLMKNFYNSPNWMMARSAVLPGWGQADAGMASGTALMTGTVLGGASLFYLNERAKTELNKYKKEVLMNTVITLVPGQYSISDRLALGYMLNNQLGGPCGPRQKNFYYGQISFGAFYAAQLIHLGWNIGIAALFARNIQPDQPITFTLSAYPSIIPGNLDTRFSLNFRF